MDLIGLPDWIDREAWEGWLEVRKKLKAPMTDRACRLAWGELDKFRKQGMDPNAILDQSTLNGWRGLFPLREGAKPAEPAATPWMEFRAAIRDQRSPADPKLKQIIKSLGGLDRLGGLSSWDIEHVIRKDFDAGWRQLAH